MKLTRLMSAVICTGALLAFSAFAQQTPPAGGDMGAAGKAGQMQGDLRASKAIGAEVKTAAGERLGKVSDLIVNPSNGRVDFAVIDWSNKLVPVPFSMLTPYMTTGRPGFLAPTGPELTFMTKLEPAKLQNAPTIEKNRWSDIQMPEWRQKVYTYYGMSPEGMGAPGGMEKGGMMQGTEPAPGGTPK